MQVRRVAAVFAESRIVLISGMVIECPECRTLASQGSNYAKLLDLAEGCKLTCQCPRCDYYWKPTNAEQALIAANLRRIMQPQ
jgi:hypothetical protein